MLPLLVLLGTIAGAWYLLIVRPQKDQQTRHGRLVDQLQVGDHVLTVGGIYGRVEALDGTSVVLELGPGLSTRIATDGIARIVQGAEAATHAMPTAPAHTLPRQATDTDMHQHQSPPDQQQFAAPAYQAPPQPYAPAAAQPVQPVQPQHAPIPAQQVAAAPYAQPPAQLAAAPAPAYAQAPMPTMQQPVAQPQPAQVAYQQPLPQPMQHTTTLRAQVVDPIPTFEPRPWGDLAPVNRPQQPAPLAQPAMQAYAEPAPAPAPAAAPLQMHVPFAPASPQPPHATMPQQAIQPQQVAATQQAMPQQAMPQQVAMPQQQVEATAAEPQSTRRHSKAPEGMGSSLRLDDPSLRDTLARARDERSGLADEYRKLTAPLVDVGQPQPVQHVEVPQDATFVGHDPNGVPLFAAPGSPVAHPVAQYPAPARVAGATAMPRPVVQAPQGAVDPALTSAAFQRRTPYAPEQVAEPALVPTHHAPQRVAAAPA